MSSGSDQAATQIESAVAQSSGKIDQHVYDEINAAVEANGIGNADGLKELQGQLNYLLPDIVIEDASVQNLLVADGGISETDVDSLSTNSSYADQLAASALRENFDNIDTDDNNDISEAELKAWKQGLNQRTPNSQPSGDLSMQSWLGPQDSETVFMNDFYSGQRTSINGITNGASYHQDGSGQWIEANTGAKITAPQVVSFDGFEYGQFTFQYMDGPMQGSTVVHKTDNSEVTTNTAGQVQRVRYPNGDTRDFTYGADGMLATIVTTPAGGEATTADVTGRHGIVRPDGTVMLDGDGNTTLILLTSGEQRSAARTVEAQPPATETETETDPPVVDQGAADTDAEGQPEGEQPPTSTDQPATGVDPNQEASVVTSQDGSTVHLNGLGLPIRVEHKQGGETTFEYAPDGQIIKIVPPEGTNAMPLERNGDKWTSNGTPMDGISNVTVNPDGTYSFHNVDGGGEYDIVQKTDGATIFLQNGNVMQIDQPGRLRAFEFSPPENPTEIHMADGDKTFVRNDLGWVNKNDPNEVYASITASPDGNVTFTRADQSAVIYKSDGTTQDVPAPVNPGTEESEGDTENAGGDEPGDGQNEGEGQTTRETLEDGSVVIKDAQGRVVETQGRDGSTTKYTYDENGLSQVKRTWGDDNPYSETYRRNADGTWSKSTDVQRMPGEHTSERVDKVEVDPSTGALVVTTGDVVKTEHVNGDDTYTRGNVSVHVRQDERGYSQIVTTVDGQVVEGLVKENDKWYRVGADGNRREVHSVSPHGDGSYSYQVRGQHQDMKVTRHLDGSQQLEVRGPNGSTRTDSVNPQGQLESTVTLDGTTGGKEEVKYDPATGQVVEVKVTSADYPEQAQMGTDLKREDNGGYSYTIGEGDAARRITVNPDGSRVEGKVLPDGTRQVSRVVHEEGDAFQFEYDAEGNITKVTQTFPPNSQNADGSSPRTTETWTRNEDGTYSRSSDGMPGRDLQVDANGNFAYTYTNPDGSLMRHVETATGDNPEDVPVESVAGDKQYGDRTFHIDENGNAVYDIVGGDTMWWIASNILTGQGVENPSAAQIWEVINKIAAENSIADPNLIYAGAKLNISKEIMTGYQQQAPETEPETDTPETDPSSDHDGPEEDPYGYN